MVSPKESSYQRKNPRYDFVRNGNNFAGLRDYARAKVLTPKKDRVVYPTPERNQGTLGLFEDEEKDYPIYGWRSRIGKFYELLARGIFGGTVKTRWRVAGDGTNLIDSEPDIVCYEKGKHFLRESKSVCKSSDLKLVDEQVGKYCFLQLSDSFATPPVITFENFRYGLRSPLNRYRGQGNSLGDNIEKMVCDLSENTRFLVSIPFSVVYKISRWKPDLNDETRITSRYDGDRYSNLTRITSCGLNALLAEPERVMKHFGLSLEDYLIEQRKSSARLGVNGVKVPNFPILIIRDKDHNAWFEEFKEQFERESAERVAQLREADEMGWQYHGDDGLFFPFKDEEDRRREEIENALPEKPEDGIPI